MSESLFGDTPLTLVESQKELLEMVAALREEPVIGVDTESDGFHRFREKVTLIQISGPDQDWIIDRMTLNDLSPLAELLENPAQVKIFHGADYDVVSLRRDFGFLIQNLFDTMVASQFLGLPEIGLAGLIKRYFGHHIDKQYQRYDWSLRPLLPEHLSYARGDTHFLLALREVLVSKLSRLGRLDRVEEECALLCERQWQGRTSDPADFLRVKGSGDLSEHGLRLLRALWGYRAEQAERMDRPVFKVIPDEVLMLLAERRFASIHDIDSAFRAGSPLLRRHRQGIWQAINEGRVSTDPLPSLPRASRAEGLASHALSELQAEALMLKLREWRNAEVSRQNLPAVAILSNQVLKSLVRVAPCTVEELSSVPDMRRWQIATSGEAVLEVIRAVIGAVPPEPKKKKRRKKAAARRKPEVSAPEAKRTEASGAG